LWTTWRYVLGLTFTLPVAAQALVASRPAPPAGEAGEPLELWPILLHSTLRPDEASLGRVLYHEVSHIHRRHRTGCAPRRQDAQEIQADQGAMHWARLAATHDEEV
jgi:hypothetical protein